MHKPSRLIAAFAFAAMLAGHPVLWPAPAAWSAQLSQQEQTIVQQVSDYFNGFSTLKGDFTQVSARGQIANGVFMIVKPGKMRFEYAPPSPLLVVSDGSWVTVQNTKRKRMDQYPLSATPLRIVLADEVDLNRDANILKVETQDNISAITLQDKDQLVSGQLTLVFDHASNQLQQWIVIDGKGDRTSIQLANVESGVRPDPALFVVQRPKDRKPKADK